VKTTRLKAAELAGSNRYAQASNRGFQVVSGRTRFLIRPHSRQRFSRAPHAFATRGRRNKFRLIGVTVFLFLDATPAPNSAAQREAAFDIDTEKQRRGLNGRAWCF
jgi:hypothetical protein